MFNKPKYILLMTVIILATLACSISGLAPSPDTAPLDSNLLPTIIAGTANAAATQTALVTTDTPPPPTPTETVTPTPTPQLVFSGFNTALRQQADGSTLFIDAAAGYQFTAPPGWTLFRPDEPEYFKLWTQPVASEPAVQKMLTGMQNASPGIYRVMGVDLRDGHIRQDFIINFDVQWNTILQGDYNKVFEAVKKTYSDLSPALTFKTLSSQVLTTPQNLEAGVMELELTLKGNGSEIKIYEKQIILKTKSGYYFIRFDSTYDFKDVTLPEFEQLYASLQTYTP